VSELSNPKPGATVGQTMRAVFWSFFGVRKRADYEHDVQRLDPRHVIIAGLLGAALFVLALVLLVKWVVSSGVAGG
jgi:preprotein translocase subunit Sec61beta